jgi:hypothetical protein
LIGFYENFPEVHHGTVHFSCEVPTQDLQKILLQFLLRVNEKKESLSLPEFTRHKIRVELEVGVADGLAFDYFNKENLERCLNAVSKNALSGLDLFFVVRYYVHDGAKRKPLKFDYYIVRFSFGEKEIEMLVHHERGPRRLAVDELIKFFFNRINRELKAKKMSTMKQISIQTVGSGEFTDEE